MVVPSLIRVLKETTTRRFGEKRKKRSIELPDVGGKRKRLTREVRVSGKRKRELLVGGNRKILKREVQVGGRRKRLMREHQPVGGKTRRLTREQQPVGGKRKTREQQSVGGKRKRLTRELSEEVIIDKELPEEVIIDKILTRLPIKSVLRFKSVSKSWLSLLSDSHFTKEHGIHSPLQNPNDYDCFVANKYSHITIFSRHQETFELPADDYFLIGSVNGLVCLLSPFRSVSLWNPSISQSMEFDLPRHSCPTLIGVSFDRASNDCKVVVCYPSCVVYSSNSNSWIQLSVPDHEFLMNKFGESSFIPTTYVKDCPYWTYPTYSSDEKMFVTSSTYSSYGTYPSISENFIKSLVALKFDATSNKFKLLPEFFPDARSQERGKIFRFVNMRDHLTLLAHGPYPFGMLDVYSLEEEKGCGVWITMHQVGPFENYRCFKFLQQGFKYGDEIVIYKNGKIGYYDPNIKKLEWLPGREAYTLLNLFTHTPSMVFLEGMKSRQTRPQ